MCLHAAPIRQACENQVDEGLWSAKKRSFAEPAIENGLIRVNAAIAEKGPVAARLFALFCVAFDDEHFFFFATGLRGDLPKGIGDERVAPEFETRIAVFRIAFVADA